MLNTVQIMGRLGRDPELKYTQNNVPVATFSLAVERDFKSDGEKVSDWIDCVAWRHTAEYISKYFSKGRMMVVSGRLQTRSWEGKEGKKHKAVEVIVENAYFADSRRAEQQQQQSGYGDFGPQVQISDGFEPIDDPDDELPF